MPCPICEKLAKDPCPIHYAQSFWTMMTERAIDERMARFTKAIMGQETLLIPNIEDLVSAAKNQVFKKERKKNGVLANRDAETHHALVRRTRKGTSGQNGGGKHTQERESKEKQKGPDRQGQ